jgi:hypothetical protein
MAKNEEAQKEKNAQYEEVISGLRSSLEQVSGDLSKKENLYKEVSESEQFFRKSFQKAQEESEESKQALMAVQDKEQTYTDLIGKLKKENAQLQTHITNLKHELEVKDLKHAETMEKQELTLELKLEKRENELRKEFEESLKKTATP